MLLYCAIVLSLIFVIAVIGLFGIIYLIKTVNDLRSDISLFVKRLPELFKIADEILKKNRNLFKEIDKDVSGT